jgi:hypothetical protein
MNGKKNSRTKVKLNSKGLTKIKIKHKGNQVKQVNQANQVKLVNQVNKVLDKDKEHQANQPNQGQTQDHQERQVHHQ